MTTTSQTVPLLYPSSIPSSFSEVKPTAEKCLTTELDIDHFEKSTGLSRTTLFLATWCFVLSMHASEPIDSVVFGWADQHGGTIPFKVDTIGLSPSIFSFLFAVEESAKKESKGAASFFVGRLLTFTGHFDHSDNVFQTVIATNGPLAPQKGHLLCLEVLPSGGFQHRLRIMTVPEVLSLEDAEWVLRHFANTLHIFASVTVLDHPLSNTVLSNAEERQLLLHSFNPPDPYHSDIPERLRLHHIVEAQAAKTPKKIALQYERSIFLTYQELDGKADRLARTLITEYKVEPGQIIPILFAAHSVDLYVSILGILKAGCAWMPLDESHPDIRLQTVVRMPGTVTLVLTSSGELSDRAHKVFGDVEIVEVDYQKLTLTDHKSRLERTQPNDLAYVLFTSGSTGEPKGVCVEHSHIVSAALAWEKLWPEGLPYARCLQFSGATFDPSVLDMFLILGTGGTLCLASKNTLGDLNNALGPLFDATFLYTVPTVAKFIDPSLNPSLSDLTIVGEPITTALRDTWASKVRLLNTYGPSEISVVATAIEVTPRSDIRLIGWAYGDNELLILDDSLELAPFGIIGEICLSGPQLTRGYLHNVAQTDKFYVPHPFRSNDRIYRTGDLGRRRADGSIEFVGRRDHQVKFRGIRLELEEISEILVRHSKVQTAVVNKVAKNGKEELVAFIGTAVPAPSSSYTLNLLPANATTIALLNELRQLTSQHLPLPLNPTIFLPFETLPCTPNGKTDRRRLSDFYLKADLDVVWQYNQGTHNIEAVPPSTQSEATLLRAWAEVLKIEETRIGVTHSWYELGGDSISAVTLSSLLRNWGLKLLPADIARVRTLREQAALAVEVDIQTSLPDLSVLPDTLATATRDQLPLLDVTDAQLKHVVDVTLSKRGIRASEVIDLFPCTALQESMIATNIERSDAYVIQNCYRLPDDIDVDRLRTAFTELIKATPALRTVFLLDTNIGFLSAVLKDELDIPFSVIPVSDYASFETASGPFGSSFPPDSTLLTRAVLIQFKDETGTRSKFIWTCHHALLDGWSLSHLESDLKQLYDTRTPINPRPSFKGFLHFLRSHDLSESIEFWKQRLMSVQPTVFPFDVTANRTVANSTISAHFPVNYQRLVQLHAIKPSTIVTAAWALVLSAHSGSRDEVVFGQVNWGRGLGLVDVENIIGPCLNTVAHNVVIPKDGTVLDYLRHIQSDQILIDKHSLVPLRSIPIPDIATLFRTIVNFYQLPASDTDSPLLTQLSEVDGVDYPLVVFATAQSTGINVEIRFSESQISRDETRLVLDHLGQALLELTSSSPSRSINTLKLSTESDSAILTQDVAFKPLQLPRLQKLGVTGVHHLIEYQASIHPQKIALQYEQKFFITYRQLDQLANRLAQDLTRYTISGDQRLIPICFNKGIDMVISILAVLKAGCAYVPIDAESWGPDRINTIVDISKARVCMVGLDLYEKISNVVVSSSVDILKVDVSALEPSTVKPEAGRVSPSDLAYVLFTSGSTGTPKGVMIEHQAIIESALASRDVFGKRSDRVLQFSAYTFDVSCWDFFATLTGGGRLCLASRDQLLSDLTAVMRDMDIQFLETTPTVAALLSKPLDSLQVLTVSGESLSSQVKETWADEVLLVNCFGPTEAAVNVTYQHVSPTTPNNNIGKRFGPNLTYVLSDDLSPVPIGCVGELYLGGPQVGRGYLNNPNQTSRTFLHNPFVRKDEIHNRLYKTGDLVRRQMNGDLVYLGRKDAQVKLRGLRIELAEIEHVIIAAASTKVTGVVVEKVSSRGQEELVTFLSLVNLENGNIDDLVAPVDMADELVPLIEEIRVACSQKLPAYMIPSLFLPLHYIPTTSAGKADRKRITTAFQLVDSSVLRRFNGLGSTDNNEGRSPPETEMHTSLRSLWATVLNLTENALGIDDDWFRAGGDSIGAIRLATAAREAGLHLLATDVIRNPTIRSQAHLVELAVINHEYDTDDVPSVSSLGEMTLEDLSLLDFTQEALERLRNEVLPKHGIVPQDVTDVYPCTPLQTSMLVASAIVSDAYLVREEYELAPGTDSARLKKAFSDLINHENGACLRTVYVFDTSSNNFLQLVMRPGWKEMEWRMVSLGHESELDAAIAEYHATYGGRRFGDAEIMTRACLFEVEGIPRRIVWIVHHAAEDAWTKYGYESDIKTLYRGHKLPERRPFKTLIKYLLSLDRTAGLDFWKEKLLTATPSPFLQPAPGAPRATANTGVTRRVHPGHSALAREYGIMASTLATTAWALVLAAHTTSSDVVFGQLVAGRSAPIRGIEEMVGVCINTVARRVIFDPNASIIDTLRNIQAEQVEIAKHEYIGLAEIQRHGVADIGGLFRTLLNIRNLPGDQELYANEGKVKEEPELLTGRGGLDGDDVALDIFVSPYASDSFALEVLFTKEIITAAEVEVLLDHYEAALFYLTRNPLEPIQNVNLVSAREAERLLPQSLDEQPLSEADNIHQLIEQQAQKTPQRIAIQFEQEIFLTYAQLDALANGLAQTLLDRGVKRGDIIGLYTDKSAELFISILAIHKVGAAYCPLDPEHPASRIQTIVVELAQSKLVLTSKELHSQLLDILKGNTDTLAVDINEITPLSTKPNVERVGRDGVCHVLFTSGTSGVPKGVVLTHGAIIESAVGSAEVFGRRDDRVLQFSNYTFDVSVWDWSATLTAGGRLCIAPKKKLMQSLGAVARDFDVTFLETTPTVAALITPQEVPSLHTLTVSGEVLTSEVRSSWASDVTLVNCYGPTECATNSLAMKHVTPTTEGSNIGYTFGRNVIYILDEKYRLVPIGCVGELFIGGPQVARGYLRNEEQTAKVFVKDPFRPGSMMYATGDLVRMNPNDGSVTYLGRRDTQIKIRGLRVEVGEIEQVLKAADSSVVNAAVIKVTTNGHEELAAFIECANVKEASDDTTLSILHNDTLIYSLKQTATRRLPSYMVPSRFIILNRFPLASSGKLDRKSLTSFFHTHEQEIRSSSNTQTTSGSSSFTKATTSAEKKILKLWQTVLKTKDEIDVVHASFADMGGDSVGMMRLSGLAFKKGISLTIKDQLERMTIREQAELVGGKK